MAKMNAKPAPREQSREAGLRRIQLWLPDTRRPEFAAECARQAQRIREAETSAADIDAWFEISDRTGWTA